MMNVPAKMMLKISEEEVTRWKVINLFRHNYDLLNAYYRVMEGKENKQYVMNTEITIGKEKVTINFLCTTIALNRKTTGEILILIYPI